MARTLAAVVLPAFAVTIAWLRLEDPRQTREAMVVAALAVAPVLLPRWELRLAAAAASAIGVVWIAFAVQPWESLPFRDERVLGPVVDDFERGLGDYYSVILPFAPGPHPQMHALLLLAIFAFVLATSLLVGARRPVAAAAVIVAGAGWPATLVSEGAVAIGALALGAALSVPLVLRVRSAPALAAGVAAASLVVVGAAWASSASTFARDAVVEWEAWDFRGRPAKAFGVRFFWDSNYEGIRFTPTGTIVLRIRGPESAQYWRASTLDVFSSDRWLEDLYPVVVREASGPFPLDRLAPRAARDRTTWIQQRVEVKALVDERLVAAGTPTAIEAPTLGTVFVLSGGVVRARHTVEARDSYRIWSYVPDPSPAALNAASATYPPAARRYLTVWGRSMPVFGENRREERLATLFSDARYPSFAAYRPVYERAREVTRSADTPYSTVLALESWLRRSGGFRYDETPPQSRTRPPLVDFVLKTRAGYCQHFAGAMAVMLRLLGIPARVAVGFTSGTYADGAWTVTDRNAHAWVEAWFPGEGWVPFDPTPGRGTFSGRYSFASGSADAIEALRRGELAELEELGRGRRTTDVSATASGRDSDGRSLFGIVVLVGALGAATIGFSKLIVRRARYLARDPRAIAAASRKELEAFMRDQGIPVSKSATLDDLRRALVEVGVDGRAFVDVAGRARFGPPGDAAYAAGVARRELRALLRGLRRQLSAWARLRGFVSLRSVRGWE
jgi:transglutaminase-like putative cysteine protease